MKNYLWLVNIKKRGKKLSTPLIDGLKKYIRENNIRMHMPGHKAKEELKCLGGLIPEIDVTEVKGVDNLQNPEGIIKKSEENASRVFKAKETLYSVNGTTAGLYAAITSQVSRGEKILISRDSHKAVYQAVILGSLNCDYIYPKYDENVNMLIGITPKQIKEKLEQDKDIKAVVINYPSYYGVCSDIEGIARVVHNSGKILIVDEAHGAHLSFHNELPKSALESGADIVIQSSHKTLPAFTQSSMVHVGTDRVDMEKLKLHMNIYQTTSPSYILMSSLDYAVNYMDKFGYKGLDRVLKKIREMTYYLKKLGNVKIYNGEGQLPYDFDETKFLFSIDGLSGTRLESILREDYNIQVELSDNYYVLSLITALDEDEDLEKLKLAIEKISKREKYKNETQDEKFLDIRNIEPKIVKTLDKAFYSEKNSVQLDKSKGSISGEFIIPYPPGIPILAPGEEVSFEIIDYIKHLKENHIEILGLNKGKIKILK